MPPVASFVALLLDRHIHHLFLFLMIRYLVPLADLLAILPKFTYTSLGQWPFSQTSCAGEGKSINFTFVSFIRFENFFFFSWVVRYGNR